MPRVTRLDERETKDIHADWWSPALDEATGRYVERCVIHAHYLQGDEDAINADLMSSNKLQLTPEMIRAAQAGDTEGALTGFNLDMGNSTRRNALLFARCVREITDDTGAPQPIGQVGFAGLSTEDATFILLQIEETKKPLVVPTSLDRELAAERGEPAQLVAERHFRDGGRARAARETS